MADSAPGVLKFVLEVTWTCLNDTPSVYKNPLFTRFFTSMEDVETIASTASINFAPGLFEALHSDSPPGIQFFKSLPTVDGLVWAVYVLILEKPGYPPRIYIGVATNAKSGVSARFKHYDEGEYLPRYVKSSLAEGFTIVTKRVICWVPIPTPAMVPINRLLFYSLEATFTCLFWAMKCSLEKDFGMGHICPWDRATLEYSGLCSHSSLNDGIIGDFDLTPEELESIAAEKEAKFREHKAVNACNYHYKQMATNYDEYIGKSSERVAKSRALNPGRDKAHQARRVAESKANMTYHCTPCDLTVGTKQNYNNHMKTNGHAIEANAKTRPFKCRCCNIAFARQMTLNRHNKLPKHQEARAAARAAQSSFVLG